MKKISAIKNQKLEKDVKRFLEIYPNYSYYKTHGERYAKIIGDIDICDTTGNYLDSFIIEVWLDINSYPYSTPLVREYSKKIERHEDWHIDEDGCCCLDIEHELEHRAKRGIELVSFYQDSIYPFFANTLYKMTFGEYANGEYGHFFEGVVQFYDKKLLLSDYFLIIKIIKAVLNNTIPGRNDRPCICGLDNKFKKCHLDCIEFLKSLPRERLLQDLVGYEELSS